MFMMLTKADGSVFDSDVFAYGYEGGVFWYQANKEDPMLREYLADYEFTRIEFYQSREAALVDRADLRDYPPLK